MMEITTADAVRIFLDGFAEEKKFPLTTKFPMPETLAAMKEAESGKLESYDSVNNFFKERKL